MPVVNCKVQYIRAKYDNLKEWMEDKNNVYIGRGCVVFIDGKRYPPESSFFANPYKIGRDGTREEVIAKYKRYMIKKINDDKTDTVKKELLSLKNKNLGCWCYPNKCHGNVLIELIDTLENKNIKN